MLYVIATPIGNAEDLSPRAVRLLGTVSLIACEDTRRAARLLAPHSINTPTVSYFEHNEHRRVSQLLARLGAGEDVALITDAGTPTISDPGYRLVRAAIDAGIRVSAVPGPSAVMAALSIAGLPTDRFVFEGFLPLRPGERRRRLERLAAEDRTIVMFEAARRLAQLLSEMNGTIGSSRLAAVVREATKTHEEVVRGTLGELTYRFNQQIALGEVTLVVEGAPRAVHPLAVIGPARIVEVLQEAGLSFKDAAAAAAKLTGESRREIYQGALRPNEK